MFTVLDVWACGHITYSFSACYSRGHAVLYEMIGGPARTTLPRGDFYPALPG
jgi:hypothetical protein